MTFDNMTELWTLWSVNDDLQWHTVDIDLSETDETYRVSDTPFAKKNFKLYIWQFELKCNCRILKMT